jgi:hypothetical protein
MTQAALADLSNLQAYASRLATFRIADRLRPGAIDLINRTAIAGIENKNGIKELGGQRDITCSVSQAEGLVIKVSLTPKLDESQDRQLTADANEIDGPRAAGRRIAIADEDREPIALIAKGFLIVTNPARQARRRSCAPCRPPLPRH